MKTITTPGGVIYYVDDIRSISAHRYNRFSQKWAQESGLGSDVFDQHSHLRKVAAFWDSDEPAAKAEFNNLLLGCNALLESAPLLAHVLAALVVKVDGEACEDLSDDGLKALATRLLDMGITQYQLAEAVSESKKNFTPN